VKSDRFTQALLVIVIALLAANLSWSRATPAEAKTPDSLDRIATALERIQREGLDVNVNGKFGIRHPIEVQIKK
jgi:hypothetical protein